MVSDDNPFRRHSTLLGFVGCAEMVFSRLFYGSKEARILDDPDETPRPVIPQYDRWRGAESENQRLVQAYEKLLEGDPSDFQRLAEEEGPA